MRRWSTSGASSSGWSRTLDLFAVAAALVVRGAARDRARAGRRGAGDGGAAAARDRVRPARREPARVGGRPRAVRARRRADRSRDRAGGFAHAASGRRPRVGRGRQPGAPRVHAGVDRAQGAVVCSEPPPDGWIEAVARRCRAAGCRARSLRAAGAEWAEADGADELSLTVSVERRVLWGTPRDPLPIAEGEEHDRVVGALPRRALDYSPPTGFDADACSRLDGTRSDRARHPPRRRDPDRRAGALGGRGGRGGRGVDAGAAAGRGRRGAYSTTATRRRWSTRSSSRSSCGSATTWSSSRRAPHPTTASRPRGDQPADPRPPARRVPRRRGRAAEAERVRLRAPRSEAAAAFARGRAGQTPRRRGERRAGARSTSS